MDAGHPDEPLRKTMKRFFVGIELGEAAFEEATNVLRRLESEVQHQGLRYVRAEKLHLTLQFLGDVDEDLESAISDRLDHVAASRQGFELELCGIGAFPAMKRPKVLWLGVGGETGRLAELHEAVGRSVSEIVPFDGKEFVPHVTLARVSPGSPAVGYRVSVLQPEFAGRVLASWHVRELVLFESTQDGRYVAVHRSPLRTE